MNKQRISITDTSKLTAQNMVHSQIKIMWHYNVFKYALLKQLLVITFFNFPQLLVPLPTQWDFSDLDFAMWIHSTSEFLISEISSVLNVLHSLILLDQREGLFRSGAESCPHENTRSSWYFYVVASQLVHDGLRY